MGRGASRLSVFNSIPLVENPGDVCSWSASLTAQVRARFHCHADGSWSMTVPDGVGGWREVIRGTYDDNMRIIGYVPGPLRGPLRD